MLLNMCQEAGHSASRRTRMERLRFLKLHPQVNQAWDLLTLSSCNRVEFQLVVAGIVLLAALSEGRPVGCWLGTVPGLKSPPHT